MTDLHGVVEADSDVRAIEYCVLGPLQVHIDGSPAALGGRKQRGVLAMLIAHSGRPVSVDTLLLATYGDEAGAGAKATLHTYVSNLRRALGEVVVRQGDAYSLDCATAAIDASSFERACARAATIEDPDLASAELRNALSMWRGHAYADIEVNGCLDGEITRLSEMRVAALEARLDADLRAGRHREVVGELDALTVEYSYRETLRGLHMLALYRCGRQADALRAYARTRELLVDDLGIDPSPELQRLEGRILAHDRDLLLTVGPIVQRGAVLAADVDDVISSDPWQRENAYDRRDHNLAAVAESEGGTKLSPRGSARYVVFSNAISAVRAAGAIVAEGVRVAIDVGDFEIRDDEPIGPPLSRAARLVAVAHPGQVLLSSSAHEALAAGAQTGWAAESLGRFDIVGLDPGMQIYQLVGRGFGSDFPPLRVDRVPPPVPGGSQRSVPGYELRQLIRAGQLGQVHRAYQPSVGREVALRLFGRSMVGHPQFVRRFETASQRVTRVEHPHVVPLLDYWREPSRAVMVTRLMTGGTLEARIPVDGFGPSQMLAVLDPIASALTSAHRHGVVHGRIRPANVLFDAEDNAFVADLGVDEICSGVISFASSAYDAPERLGGALATPLSDVYSLGVLVQHMLTGSPPPLDRGFEVSDGPASAALGRATDADPARRHQSIEELIDELRDAFAVPAAGASTFVAARNPYRGLEAFEQADCDDFHGRQRSVAEMVSVLQNEPLLIVVGPSGIGKSSAVKAGLLPALASGALPPSDGWLVTEMVPGRSPFENLAAALDRVATAEVPDVVESLMSASGSLAAVVDDLAPGNAGALILVDQLEELFTQTLDEAERRAFLKMLSDVARASDSTVRIVATLRADYFDRPLAYPGVDDAIQGRTVALGALSADELRDAIRLPAGAVGVEIDQGVVDRIVAEAELQPGALPLVQHTLSELFGARSTNTITVDDLDGIGGVAGAVGRRAEHIYESLDDRGRVAAEHIFLRLVSVTEDHSNTRRRVRRTELEQGGISVEALEKVLTAFGGHRLLTFDRDPASRTPTVELAHEALLTDWERYAAWVDEAREDLLARRRVETATNEWLTSGSDDSFLYSGGRLELAEAWAAHSRFGPNDEERRFLDTSRAKVDRDRIKRSRRRRGIVVVLAAAAVAAVVMAVVALVQRRDADQQADETRAREFAGLATQAIDEDPQRAILLGLAAVDLAAQPPAEALSALHRATQHDRLVWKRDGVLSPALAQSPDGSLLALAHFDGSGYELIDAASGTRVADFATDFQIGEAGLAFDPTGHNIAAVEGEHTDRLAPVVQFFDRTSGQPVGSLRGPLGSYGYIAYDTTGHWFAAAYVDPDGVWNVMVWNLQARGEPKLFGPTDDWALGADGTSIVTRKNKDVLVSDLATGRQLRAFNTPTGEDYASLQVDPTGTLAVLLPQTASRVDVIDMATGEIRRQLPVRAPYWAHFSPDGRYMAVAGDDGLIRVYDTQTFVEHERLAGTGGPPDRLLFAPDNSRLVSERPGEIRAWDLSPAGPRRLGNFHASGGAFDRLVVNADESTAYVTVFPPTGSSSSVHRVDIRTGSDEVVFSDIPYYFSTKPLVSPDGSVVAILDHDFVSEIVDLDGGRSTRLRPCESVRAFDRNGRVAAIDTDLLCEERGLAPGSGNRIADLVSGETLVELQSTPAVYAAAFGPPENDGLPVSAAVVDRDTSAVTLYDLATGDARGTYVPDPDHQPESIAISPDGRHLALLTWTGRLVVLDIDRFVKGDDQTAAIVFDQVAHAAGAHMVAISENGLIATGSSLDGVRVWAPDGELLANVATQQADAPTFAFAPGSDTLYYEDGDGIVRRFDTDQAEVERLARSALTRGFTPQECDQYFRGETCPTFGT